MKKEILPVTQNIRYNSADNYSFPHIPMINQTGGPSFLQNAGITAGGSTIAFDIGLIKPS